MHLGLSFTFQTKSGKIFEYNVVVFAIVIAAFVELNREDENKQW